MIANGATQTVHPDFEVWFPNNGHKCVPSDSFLKKQIFCKQISSLKPNAKVVIIGGSHSGFSCAWMLLNGPAANKFKMKAPNANRKVQK